MNINDIGREIIEQDNMATDCPVYVVEKRDFIVSDKDYGETELFWIRKESGIRYPNGCSVSNALDVLSKHGLLNDGEWIQLYLAEHWSFVSAFFTSKAAYDFLEQRSCDRKQSWRVLCYSMEHNPEYQAVRDHLVSLAEVDR